MPSLPPARYFAIVPAAGQSRRMGSQKLLLPWGPRTLIEATLAAWQHGGVDQVVVVCQGSDSQLVAICRAAGAHVVTVSRPPAEMKDSVAIALAAVARDWQPGTHDAWLLAPADMPQLSPTVISHLRQAHTSEESPILVPVHEGRRGHPVLFPWRYATEVSRLSADQGVNALLQQYPVHEIEAGTEAVVTDCDTPEEYRALLEARGKSSG